MRWFMTSVVMLGVLHAAMAQETAGNKTPIRVPIVLAPGEPGSPAAPRYSPKGDQLKLESKAQKGLAGFEHLEARLKLGPHGKADAGQLLVLARSSKGKPYDLLFVDADGDGKLDEKPVTTTAKVIRDKIWSSFTSVVHVNHAKPGEKAAREAYPVSLWVVVEKESDTPEIMRTSRRGFLAGEVTLGEQKVDVILSDSNNDGVFARGDWWELRSAKSKAGEMRTVGDYAWANGKAWKLELEGTNGRKGALVSFDPGVTEAEDLIKRDRLRADRLAVRAAKPVPFRKDVDATLKEIANRKAALFIKFETDWCIPCKEMAALVFTAKDVADAAAGLTCLVVDGDARKDLTEKHNVKGYPTGVLLDAEGKEIARYTGYQSVKEMTAFFQRIKK